VPFATSGTNTLMKSQAKMSLVMIAEKPVPQWP